MMYIQCKQYLSMLWLGAIMRKLIVFVTVFTLAIGHEILHPRTTRVHQNDGKDVKIRWTIESPTKQSLVLTQADFYRRTHSGEILMTRFAGRRQKVIADLATDFLLVYSNDLSLVISPYNNSLYSGSYFVTANFTTGNKTYSDEVSFELRSRSVDDEEDDEELVFIQQSLSRTRMSYNTVLIIIGFCAVFAILVVVALIIYKRRFMKMEEAQHCKPDV